MLAFVIASATAERERRSRRPRGLRRRSGGGDGAACLHAQPRVLDARDPEGPAASARQRKRLDCLPVPARDARETDPQHPTECWGSSATASFRLQRQTQPPCCGPSESDATWHKAKPSSSGVLGWSSSSSPFSSVMELRPHYRRSTQSFGRQPRWL